MKTLIVDERLYYRSTGTRSTSLVRVLQKIITGRDLNCYEQCRLILFKNFYGILTNVSGSVSRVSINFMFFIFI